LPSHEHSKSNNQCEDIYEPISKFQDLETERQDDLAMLGGMRDYLAGFKGLMDSTSRDELEGLMQQFPGLCRLAKLLERVAAGIQSGAIQVPK
jgi:hypothetical protein